MEKPITVRREEFVTSIVKVINESQLPAFVKMEVLSNCVRELSDVARAEYQRDLQAMKKEEKTEE